MRYCTCMCMPLFVAGKAKLVGDLANAGSSVQGLAELLASLKLSDHLGAADAWCVEQGAEDVSDLKVGVGVRALRLRARPRPS